MLRTHKTSILNSTGQSVTLRGVNFGGWLMMEAYFMHAPNVAEQVMKKDFARALGAGALRDLETAFRSTFIQESDMRQVAAWGFNSVRLPFNCRAVESAPYRYQGAGLEYIDRAVDWAEKYGVYVILDLHAAPGAQNHDWHSDSLGKAELWTKASNRKRVYALWEFLADRYKDKQAVAGYDILNEPVMNDPGLLNEFYREVVKSIRRADKSHILFIEGNRWSQDLEVMEDYADDNWVYSIHFYEPLEFTFNFVPGLTYPLPEYDRDTIRRRMEGYHRFAQARQRPIHVGEWGVHYRDGLYQEHTYVKDVRDVFEACGFHWNYWPYKAVKHYMFPDGLFSYYPNPAWVHRPGPVTGWNRWKDLWPKDKKAMTASWRTEAFTLNDKVLRQLR